MAEEIVQRTQRAAESILENEALTADLDDTAADVLLNWGITRAKQIAGQTIAMDAVQAEEALYLPLRALRKMLRAANQWARDPQERNLGRFLKQAAIVYETEVQGWQVEGQNALTTQTPSTPLERLRVLQQFVEGPQNDPPSVSQPANDGLDAKNEHVDGTAGEHVSIFE